MRELQNALEHALNFTDGNEIRTEHLPTRILYATWTSEHQDPKSAEDAFSLNNALISAEHQTLVNALSKCRNNRTEAAKLLGISRSTLYEKLKKHRVACERPAVKSQSPSQHPNEGRHGLRRDEPRT